MTKNYLGYSKDNKTFTSYKSNAFIEIKHSIRDMIMNLGLENQFYNIFHISTLYMKSTKKINNEELLTNIIRTRCNNLRQIIYRTISIIQKINNKHENKGTQYNKLEHSIIKDFQKSLEHINTDDMFSKIYTIVNNINTQLLDDKINFDKINLAFSKHYLNCNILIDMNNIDCKLIFYYIDNLSKLIKNNELPAIKTSVSYLIIKLIVYFNTLYNISVENAKIRLFDATLLSDTPYIDESLKIVGYYQELVTAKDIDETSEKEKDQDMREEQDALDMDGYDEDDLYEDYDQIEDDI